MGQFWCLRIDDFSKHWCSWWCGDSFMEGTFLLTFCKVFCMVSICWLGMQKVKDHGGRMQSWKNVAFPLSPIATRLDHATLNSFLSFPSSCYLTVLLILPLLATRLMNLWVSLASTLLSIIKWSLISPSANKQVNPSLDALNLFHRDPVSFTPGDTYRKKLERPAFWWFLRARS